MGQGQILACSNDRKYGKSGTRHVSKIGAGGSGRKTKYACVVAMGEVLVT